MPSFYRTLTPELAEFIERQKIFFTATAPSDDGRINISPKGYDCFRIINDQEVCYLNSPAAATKQPITSPTMAASRSCGAALRPGR